MPARMSDAKSLPETIMALCHERGPTKTICPTEAAKAMAQATGGDELAWREWLPKVRQEAIRMAREHRIVIYRKGKPADPDDVRGVIRLGLPRDD